ncbi:MAG: hypothetical protein FJ317_06410 [SAR202 cluster bacterium]|nr:hypothetical protein [SAR202 cluster bacterium]
MGFLGGLFGGRKAPRKGKFVKAIDIMQTMSAKSDLRPTNKIGIVCNPGTEDFFKRLDRELTTILMGHPATKGTRFQLIDDAYTSRWIVFDDRDVSRLTNAAVLVANAFTEREYKKRLLAVAVQVEYERRKAYWIYSYKRERFYPFIPTGEKTRDGKAEIRLGEMMERAGVSVERTLELWYPLWGIPF